MSILSVSHNFGLKRIRGLTRVGYHPLPCLKGASVASHFFHMIASGRTSCRSVRVPRSGQRSDTESARRENEWMVSREATQRLERGIIRVEETDKMRGEGQRRGERRIREEKRKRGEPRQKERRRQLTCITACFLTSSSYSESNILLFLKFPSKQIASPAEIVCCCCFSFSLVVNLGFVDLVLVLVFLFMRLDFDWEWDLEVVFIYSFICLFVVENLERLVRV